MIRSCSGLRLIVIAAPHSGPFWAVHFMISRVGCALRRVKNRAGVRTETPERMRRHGLASSDEGFLELLPIAVGLPSCWIKKINRRLARNRIRRCFPWRYKDSQGAPGRVGHRCPVISPRRLVGLAKRFHL